MPFIISITKSWSPTEGVLSMMMHLYCLENSKRKGQLGCMLPNMLCSCDHLRCSLVALTTNPKISKPSNNFTQTSFEWTSFTMSLHMDEITIYKASLLGNLFVWLVTLIYPKNHCASCCALGTIGKPLMSRGCIESVS
jgi:hypothetical protein